MSSIILKYITNRILKDNQWNRFGVEDPYNEYVPIDNINGKVKYKRIPRRIPDGISNRDLKVLEKFKRRAYRYDMWFSLFGVKFGWTNIVGIIPVFGTIVSAYWSLELLQLARTLEDGFPLDLQILFLVNIVIDFLLGLIPIVGDLIEIGYKSNSRNYLLLEKHLIRVGQKNLGLITKDEVRPNFINDKIQPYVDETLKPQAKKAGEQFKSYLQKSSRSHSSSSASSFQPSITSGVSTTHTSPTTVVTGTSAGSKESKSIASSNSDTMLNFPSERPTFEGAEANDIDSNYVVSQHGIPDANNPVFREEGATKSLRSLKNSGRKEKDLLDDDQ